MSATVPTGLCQSQSSPYQNATAKQTTVEKTNRPQNAPPIVLTFSWIEPPIDLQTLVSQPRILSPPNLHLQFHATWETVYMLFNRLWRVKNARRS